VRHLLLFSILLIVACSRPPREPERGNAQRGRELIVRHECYDCHIIPGIDFKPGPGIPVSLAEFADRKTITSDAIPMTRATLEQYIQKPKSVYALALMPGIGTSPDEARDIAAYLMTLD
jgi:cytochrome c